MTQPSDPELEALRADLARTYGEGRWYCFRGVPTVDGGGGLLYAWLMPPTTPQVLMGGRTPAAVEARIMKFYDVLANPDPSSRRSPGSQARDAAESLDVSEYES